MTELPAGTVTFLFTDVEGSTRLWEEHPDVMRSALARHDELLRSSIEAHRGYVVKTTGDGVHAAFANAHDATEAAISAQLALGAASWDATGPLRVRMGIHAGSAELRDGDYYGTAVNRAARIMAVAHGGQIVASLAAQELVRDAGIELVDLGEHRLKDLGQPERLFQVVHAELERAFPPVRSLDRSTTNLPVQATSFVGREAELAAVMDALAEVRMVTLTGVGGVGKTRLALQVAAELSPEFPDGVWLVELAAVGDPDAVADAVASTLGLVPQPGLTTTAGIAEVLAPRRSLVVLDNCEHVLDAAASLVEAVLGRPGTAKVLATSREGLGVASERLWPVPSLGARDGGRDAAVALFVDRARSMVPDFDPEAAGHGEAIEEICERLDGVPLAIELAAARTIAMSPTEVRDRLDDRFKLLAGSRRGLERHQTLRHAVQWSYGLLDDDERKLLDRSSVFAGGFDLDAATAVAGGERHRPVRDWFDREWANLRAAFHAAADTGDLDAAATIAAVASPVGYLMERFEPFAWAERLLDPAREVRHRLLASLYAAASQCCAGGRIDDGVRYAETARALVDDAHHELLYPGYATMLVASAYLHAGRPDGWAEMCTAVIDNSDQPARDARAHRVMALAFAQRFDEACALAGEAVEAAEAAADELALMAALVAYGMAWFERDPSAALEAMRRAQVISSEIRLEEGGHAAIRARAEAAHGEPAAALGACEDALRAYAACGDRGAANTPLARPHEVGRWTARRCSATPSTRSTGRGAPSEGLLAPPTERLVRERGNARRGRRARPWRDRRRELLMDRVAIISVDGHVKAPRAAYREYIESKYLDRFDDWVRSFEGTPDGFVSGAIGEDAQWDPQRRITDLESQGVVGEVLFSNGPPFAEGRLDLAPDPEITRQGAMAYNRWLADFCSAAPGRLCGQAMVPFHDVDQAVADIHWVKEQGLGGILMPPLYPGSRFFFDPELDPIWAACVDVGLPLSQHGGTGAPNYQPMGFTAFMVLSVEHSFFSGRSLWQLILGGVFERFPELKLAFVETEAWWIAPVMGVLDMRASIGDEWTEFAPMAAGGKPYRRLPSEYWATNCFAGLSPFMPGQVSLDRIGSAQDQSPEGFAIRSDNAMFGVDYPHPETIFPSVVDQARELVANPHVTEDDARKVLYANAADLYHFDLSALRPHVDRVGFELGELATTAA